MNIKVNIKQIGKKKNKISGVDFPLAVQPRTVRELITECVKTCVEQYLERAAKGDNASPLTAEQIDDMSEIGKIAFGINYGTKLPDPAKAIADAHQAYEDGLFRIFLGEESVGEIDDPVTINEGDEATFIRLVFLAGSWW